MSMSCGLDYVSQSAIVLCIYMQSSNLQSCLKYFFHNFVNENHGEVGPQKEIIIITELSLHNFIHSCSGVLRSDFPMWLNILSWSLSQDKIRREGLDARQANYC